MDCLTRSGPAPSHDLCNLFPSILLTYHFPSSFVDRDELQEYIIVVYPGVSCPRLTEHVCRTRESLEARTC